MADTFTSDKILARLQEVGANENTWGGLLNTNAIEYLAAAIADYRTLALNTSSAGTTTLSAAEARSAMLKITGAMAANGTMEVPASEGGYKIWNATTGGFTVTVRTPAGTGIAVIQDSVVNLWCDGTNVVRAQSSAADYDVGTSGTKVPLLSTANTWTLAQTFSAGIIFANETMSTYDEGTWTAAYACGSGSASLTNATMSYNQTGKKMSVGGRITVNTISTPGGALNITGLPATVPNNNRNYAAAKVYPQSWASSLTTAMAGRFEVGDTKIRLQKYSATGGIGSECAGDLANSCDLFVSGEYMLH